MGLEPDLSAIVRSLAIFASVGDEDDQLGAGRIPSTPDIALRIRHATGIILVPSNSAGCLWELDYVTENPSASAKTAVLMPPAMDSKNNC